MRIFTFIVLAIALACQPTSRFADTTTARTVAEGPIVLRNGPNAIDLLGDGTPAQAFVAWRGNYNAHGYSALALYLRAASDRNDTAEWQIVPRFGGPFAQETGRDLFTTSEGADCTLGDLRLVQHRGRTAELIVARRELGSSFADSAATYFDYYKLSRNTGGIPGWPPYYFEFVRTVDAHRQYCDVNVAFDQELHLGRHGLAESEANQ
jgi:hypothetical protein